MENFLGNEKLVSLNPFKKYLLGAYSGLWTVNHRRCYLVLMAEKRKEMSSLMIGKVRRGEGLTSKREVKGSLSREVMFNLRLQT